MPRRPPCPLDKPGTAGYNKEKAVVNMNGYYLAIDIGASSGRHIVGWREEGAVRTKEVYRFPNGAAEAGGHLTWDVDALLAHVKAGIQAAVEAFGRLESFSIDTWGVDYMLLKGEE